MSSVIYVDLSSDSEDEGPPDAKRARREAAKLHLSASKQLPSKLLQIQKATISKVPATVAVALKTTTATTTTTSPAVGANATTTTAAGAFRSMQIPSGITVTKHNVNMNSKLLFEPNNNNSSSNNNNNNNNNNSTSLKSKSIKLTTVGQKAPATLATITSVPTPQSVKLSPMGKAWLQKPSVQSQLKQPCSTATITPHQQQKSPARTNSQLPQKPTAAPLVMAAPLVKPALRLTAPPTMQITSAQKLPLKLNPIMLQRLPTVQIKTGQKLTAATTLPAPSTQPPALSATTPIISTKKVKLATAPPAAHISNISSNNIVRASASTPPLLAKLTASKPSLVVSSVNNNSAARTMPYKPTAAVVAATTVNPAPIKSISTTTPTQSLTAGATPPLRLLATPPHCAAALNEPLLLNLPPTTSITPQLTPTTTPPPPTATAATTLPLSKPNFPAASISPVSKPNFPAASISPVTKPAAKRVQPITVLKKSDEEWRKHMAQQQLKEMEQQKQQKLKEQRACTPTIVLVESPPTTPPTEKEAEPVKRKLSPAAASGPASLVSEYSALLQLCRELDKTPDMTRLIDTKLLKYYHSVHESFVRSRGFRKQLEQTMERIRAEPDMIYVHLKCVVDELKVRRKAKAVVLEATPPVDEETSAPAVAPTAANIPAATSTPTPSPTATPSTGNKRTDERIRKLNRTLYTITKRISALEEADVDWNDDDDSSYLQVERYKKRACQIYEKICDLTGESKSAHRQLKQPICFKDSPHPQFNRTLSAFVNRMHEFPDYHDVLQLLEHCNKEKELGLATFEMKRIAHDAFVKVGRLLQARRKTDLYETVTHFTANAKDPAASDADLLAKLNENNKKQTKISDILEKFAREQDLTTEEQREARLKEKQLQQQQQQQTLPLAIIAVDADDKPSTSAEAAQALSNGSTAHAVISESESEEDEDESDEDVDTFVDNFKANGDLSDADVESDTEANASPKTITAAANVIVNDVTRVKTAAIKENVEHDYYYALDNGMPKDATATGLTSLKVISVSSLNASVSKEQQQQQQQQKQQQPIQSRLTIGTEIVISDEES
ncbi:DLP [Drosophila busckii]|uniref:DLP n=1 Tax=Drosophila busckii TaxID=30019 RepID=A0A0M5J230_DROBS|nr:DLP [Drosophila busckii]